RAGDESSVDGLNAGADDYLVKPFSRPELVARVRANLNASRARERATREAARRAEQLERLVDVGLRITARLEPEDVLAALAGEARALFGARSAHVADELGNEHTSGQPPSGEDEQVVPIVSQAISATVALTLRLAPSADFDGEQRALGAQLALVGAGALERARLHAAERDTVRRLQESLLPRRLPAVPDLQLAVRYLPAADIAAVGGDWYDVVALPDERLALVVGDVVGHGLGAAATMSSLRNVLRAFLIEGEGAAQALLRMHLLADRAGAGLTATICCVILDPHTGAASWASAGHPPPLRVTAAGAAAYVLAGANQQPALGVGAPAAARDTCFTLSPGDTLLLYTDGLIEPPDRSDGYLALPGLAGRRAPDLDAYCDELIDRLAPSGSRRDDVALLALRRDIAGFD
ncbi:MAG: fused response regulator/phosphatase, partial [Solirubrobacteraceae bacterium]